MEGASPTGGHERTGDAPSFPIAADLRGILEWVAERLDVGGAGDNRLELLYRDGRLVKVCRHENLGAKALEERFA
jgi:hypothetical protein